MVQKKTELEPTPVRKEINLRPVIKIPPPKVTVQPNSDLSNLTQEIAKLVMFMQDISKAQHQLMTLQMQMLDVLQNRKEPAINVQVPEQKRGSKEYYVEFDKEDDGEVVGMRVVKS